MILLMMCVVAFLVGHLLGLVMDMIGGIVETAWERREHRRYEQDRAEEAARWEAALQETAARRAAMEVSDAEDRRSG